MSADATAGKGARTRARLIDAAIDRFAVAGYRSTSLASVARAVNLTPAAAYPYFRTKQELLIAAVETELGRLLDQADADAGSAQFPWLARFAAIVSRLPERPLLQAMLLDGPPEVVEQLSNLSPLRAWRERLIAEIAVGQALGLIREGWDPAEIALGLETIFLGLASGSVRLGLMHNKARRDATTAVILNSLLNPSQHAKAGPPQGG